MGFAEGFSAGANAKNNRDVRRQQAMQRNQDLQITGYQTDDAGNITGIRPNSQAEEIQLKAEEAIMRSRALFGKVAKQETASAFEEYSLTGDATYLNNDLHSSPEKKAAWAKKGVHLVSNIDFENDANLLSRAGLNPSAYDTEEKRDVIKRNAYKLYNGKDWSIGLANQAMAETGAYKTLGQRRATPAMENHKQLVSLLSGPKVNPYTAEGHKYEKHIMAAAEKYRLPPNLIAAQMEAESNNNPNAVSTKGATGLMQLMPETAKELGVTDMKDPAQNIDAGARYLRQQMDKYGGDVKLALAAYNAGPGNVDKYGGVPPFPETQNYIQKISSRLDEAESYYGGDSKDLFDRLLNADRQVALASQGKTEEEVKAAAALEERKVDQGDRTLDQNDRTIDIDLANKVRTADQKDRELDIEENGQLVKLQEIRAKLATEGKSNEKKKLDDAAKTTNELYEQFGGEDQFYKTDLSDTNSKEYRDAFSKMVEIEQLTNMAPKETDEKEWKELRTLIHIGGDVANLTDEQTGIVDRNLNNVKKYIDENMTGVEATSAWSAFRNIYIHAMAGTAQTEHEAKRISEAFGKLDYKLGPVIAHFSSQLKELDARLDSSSRNLLPVSAKVRLDADKNDLAAAQANVRRTIGYLEAKQNFVNRKSKIDPGTYEQYLNRQKELEKFVTED